MKVTARVTGPADAERTLADLADDVLASVSHQSTTQLYRFRRADTVYGLDDGTHGEVRRTGHTPKDYEVLSVNGSLTFSFED